MTSATDQPMAMAPEAKGDFNIDDSSPWTAQQIREHVSDWCLAGDEALLRLMETMTNRLVTFTEELNDSLLQLQSEQVHLEVRLENSLNAMSALANHQFIENKVDEDDDILKAFAGPSPEKVVGGTEGGSNETTSTELVKQILSNSLAVLEDRSVRVEALPHVAGGKDSTESAGASVSGGYEPWFQMKDPYSDRPLPFIIGSKEFFQQPTPVRAIAEEKLKSASADRMSQVNVAQPLARNTSVETTTDSTEAGSTEVVKNDGEEEESFNGDLEALAASPLFANRRPVAGSHGPARQKDVQSLSSSSSSNLFDEDFQRKPPPLPSFPAAAGSDVRPTPTAAEANGSNTADSQSALPDVFRSELEKLLFSKGAHLDSGGGGQPPPRSQTVGEGAAAASVEVMADQRLEEGEEEEEDDDLFVRRPPPLLPRSKEAGAAEIRLGQRGERHLKMRSQDVDVSKVASSCAQIVQPVPAARHTNNVLLFPEETTDNRGLVPAASSVRQLPRDVPPVPYVPPLPFGKVQKLPSGSQLFENASQPAASTIVSKSFPAARSSSSPTSNVANPVNVSKPVDTVPKKQTAPTSISLFVNDDEDDDLFAPVRHKGNSKAGSKSPVAKEDEKEKHRTVENGSVAPVDRPAPMPSRSVVNSLFDSDDDDILFGDVVGQVSLKGTTDEQVSASVSAKGVTATASGGSGVESDLFSFTHSELNQKLASESDGAVRRNQQRPQPKQRNEDMSRNTSKLTAEEAHMDSGTAAAPHDDPFASNKWDYLLPSLQKSRAKIPSSRRKLPNAMPHQTVTATAPGSKSINGRPANSLMPEASGDLLQPTTLTRVEAGTASLSVESARKAGNGTLSARGKEQDSRRVRDSLFDAGDDDDLFVTKDAPSEPKLRQSRKADAFRELQRRQQQSQPSAKQPPFVVEDTSSALPDVQKAKAKPIAAGGLFDEDDESYLELFR